MSDRITTNSDEASLKEGKFMPSGMPFGGLPARAAQADDSSAGDSPSLVYRAFTVGGSSAALLRTAATVESIKAQNVATCKPLTSLTETKAQLPPPPLVTIKYVDTERPLSFTHVLLPLADGEVLKSVDSFLTSRGISSEKRHPQSNIYHCHTVMDCSIVRFDVRLVPGQATQGVNVEFKRSGGSAESFSKIYKQFKSSIGCEGISSRSSSPVSPPTLSIDGIDSDQEEVDETEIAKVVRAMALWIERDPIEALQCVGQFYIAQNKYVAESAAILASICRVIESCEDLSDDCAVLTSTVAMSCVRQFMICARQVHSSNDISTEHVSIIATGIAKAAMGKDLTARREAVGLLVELNPRFSADIKEMRGLSFELTDAVLG